MPEQFTVSKKPHVAFVILAVLVLIGYGVAKRDSLVFSDTDDTDEELASLPSEIALLLLPGPEAPAAVVREHEKLAKEAAVEGTVLDVADCTVSPTVLKVRRGESITIRNSVTTTDVVLFIDATRQITVPRGGSALVGSDFYGTDTGSVAYKCYHPDDASLPFSASGVILITE